MECNLCFTPAGEMQNRARSRFITVAYCKAKSSHFFANEPELAGYVLENLASSFSTCGPQQKRMHEIILTCVSLLTSFSISVGIQVESKPRISGFFDFSRNTISFYTFLQK